MKTRRFLAGLISVALLTGCGAHHTTTAAHRPAAPTQAAMGQHAPANWGAPVWGKPTGPTLSAGTREQFDTITLSTVPSGASYLAGYTAGFWPTYFPLVRAFPKAHVKSIAIFSVYHADCLDVEPGDASPSQVVGWVRADLAAGFKRPCVYSSLWTFTNVIRSLLAHAGISRSSIFEWDADYIYVSRLDPSFDCTQWTNKAFGRNLDESTCTLAFLGVAPTPAPKPKPKPKPKPPVKQVCFGKHPVSTPGCQVVQREVAAWRAQAAADLANAARVTRRWS